ncbi:MAG: single-stranded DNA-binding protein [Ignavibacterium sp.]|nr:single-stranded DNA-binding protein [Ignavibacterium sp.]MCX7611415.1 single-stranded DNA-binding protein [Ignavibacterium sp.]MDW8375231.1 single-stranded DNA-binding protein [Ignavibacteriales bacterium]
MAFSLNKIMLIGHLGRDAEVRFSTDNYSITTFSLATNYSYKNKNGEWTDETTWHNVIAINLSDYYKEVLKKGKKVYVEGRLVSRTYEDKEKVKRTVYEVRAERIIPLDPSSENIKPEIDESKTVDSVDEATSQEDDLPF